MPSGEGPVLLVIAVGVGDEAFTSTTGLAVLSHGAVIEILGPSRNGYVTRTAIAKAMIAALHEERARGRRLCRGTG